MLIVAGEKCTDGRDLLSINRLSERFGVTFSGHAENPDELLVSTASHFFSTGSPNRTARATRPTAPNWSTR